MSDVEELAELRQAADTRAYIDTELAHLFAPEDDALQGALAAARENDMPAIQIAPLQGKMLQILAAACGARKILEIGALAGYSSVWLARALPPGGRLISLEVSEKHAAVARSSLERAGVGDRAEVRVGPGEQLLPELLNEAPFDLVFIDADKPTYPTYLDWALKLTRPGSIIVADNCVRSGTPLRALRGDADANADTGMQAIATYDRQIASDPRLISIAFPMDEDGMDGFAISVVRDQSGA